MNQYSATTNDFAMDSRTLGGSLSARLQAVSAAGFTQLTLCAADLVNHPDGVDAAVACVAASGLRVTALHALDDFDGLTGALHRFKVDVAKSMLTLCQALNCHLLIVNACTLAQASGEQAALTSSLRQLAMLAIPKHIRIAYRALPEARTIKTYGQAWDLTWQADMPNLGLCLDAVDVLAGEAAREDIDFLEPDKLFLVQLSDLIDGAPVACSVFPGVGSHSAAIAALVTTLHELGYRGDYSLNAAHPDYRQMPLMDVTAKAWRSALWLGQDVLQRSVPLPNQIRLRRQRAAGIN